MDLNFKEEKLSDDEKIEVESHLQKEGEELKKKGITKEAIRRVAELEEERRERDRQYGR